MIIPRRARARRACGRILPALQPKQLDPDTLDVEELKQRFLVVQAVEAARTVEDHVITDMREADVGSILGFGFAPFTGGTLSYIDFMGTKKFVELCHKLEAKYGSRFTPPKLLEEMAAQGRDLLRPLPAEEAGRGVKGMAVPANAGTQSLAVLHPHRHGRASSRPSRSLLRRQIKTWMPRRARA